MRHGEWVKEVERNSWASFKARGSTTHAKQLLASSAARVAAWAVAARCGGAGRGPARGGEGWAQCWRGTWRGEERRGAAGARENGRRRRRGRAQRETERGGAGGRRFGDLAAIFRKCRDSTINPKQLSNHSLNVNVPKIKSVELNKIYNFALRVNFKRVKDLNLI
jgi:hypothetical protein